SFRSPPSYRRKAGLQKSLKFLDFGSRYPQDFDPGLAGMTPELFSELRSQPARTAPTLNELALLRQLLGTGIGNPALGFLVARHDRPTLRVNIAALFPSIFVLHFDEFLALRRIPVELRHANRSQTLGHRSDSGLLRHCLGSTARNPSTPVESDNG